MSGQMLKLSADLDRVNVASLAREASEMVASGVSSLRLDGAAVVRARLCSVQLLVSAAASAAAAGIPFRIEQPSGELVAAVELAGLTDFLFADQQG